jgi:CBS domain-containing protein
MMIPLSEYHKVDEEATLYEAVLALEKTQAAYSEGACPHRALLVTNKAGKVIGRVSQWDVLRALEPKYELLGDADKLSRVGFSHNFLKDMLKRYGFWNQPLRDICSKGTRFKVKNFMYAPQEGDYVAKDATLDEAIHILLMGQHHSLLVTDGEEVVGVLMLRDVFSMVCEEIRSCKI